MWLLLLLMKGVDSNWPNHRFACVFDQMYVSPSQLSPSALVTQQTALALPFGKEELNQHHSPWNSRKLLESHVFFSLK